MIWLDTLLMVALVIPFTTFTSIKMGINSSGRSKVRAVGKRRVYSASGQVWLSTTKNWALAATLLSGVVIFCPAASYADVMMFRSGGKVTTNGWTFHGTSPENVEQLDQANTTVSTRSETHPSTTVGRPAVMSAILSASTRHRRNRAIRAVGLSHDQWHTLFRSLIQAESAFNPNARSPKGAIGLGQLMPATARTLGVNPNNMEENLDGAARYFLTQLNKFGSVELALAAYNAGPHRVEEYGGVPPFRETRNFIARINRLSGGLGGFQVASAN